jgi:uncharacterized membrane-anchored protein
VRRPDRIEHDARCGSYAVIQAPRYRSEVVDALDEAGAGFYAAHGFVRSVMMLGAALAAVTYARSRFAPAAIVGYWTIVLVERPAGTPLGDWLASRHGLGLGLPVASVISAALFIATLEWRRRAGYARP